MSRTLVVALLIGSIVQAQERQEQLGSRSAPVIREGQLRFKDLNRNGALDPYENWRLSPSVRARDLVAKMTVEEKAGLMMHGTARAVGPIGGAGIGARYDTAATAALIRDAHVSSFITRLGGDPADLAQEHNALQAIAEATRLGIPLTISTDPRNHFQYVIGASVRTGRFTQWPEPLGFAALRDPSLVRRFGDIARREYRAVGIHMTLSPQADLATEPRWSRINGTFGEDADLARDLIRAYVEGFQGRASSSRRGHVLAVVKHWVGYGAALHGFDSHSPYGRFASFPDGNLDYHIKPFLGAFEANVAGVMPTYSILNGATLDGRAIEQVGAGFNKQLLTDLLRRHHGFRGVILSDWGITSDCDSNCLNGFPAGTRPSFRGFGTPWGLERATMAERFKKAIEAGMDQFGGAEDTPIVVQLVKSGAIPEQRLNESAQRVLVQKFELGLFENPYVDVAAARSLVGVDSLQHDATATQSRSLVVLENRKAILPIDIRGKRVFLHRVSPEIAREYGFTVVDDPAKADVAVLRIDAPFERLHPQYMFGSMQNEGNLGFPEDNADYALIKRVSAAVPTILTVYLDRPAILTNVNELVAALLANFGVSDAALFNALTGRVKAAGKLPFQLPSSMSEVEKSRPDRPKDLANPLYPFGFWRSY
jgi:beta-glucosidase